MFQHILSHYTQKGHSVRIKVTRGGDLRRYSLLVIIRRSDKGGKRLAKRHIGLGLGLSHILSLGEIGLRLVLGLGKIRVLRKIGCFLGLGGLELGIFSVLKCY